MTSIIRSAAMMVAIAAVFACTAAVASAGITVGPASTNIVALSTNTVLNEPGVAISCQNASAVGTVPAANTSLTNPIDVPILLYFGGTGGGGGTCSASIGGNIAPVTVTSLDQDPGDHTLRVNQDHSLSVLVSADMITISIPSLACSIVIGATTVPVSTIGTLDMVTGFQVTTATIPRLSDSCPLSGTSTFSGTYTVYTNTGTMLAPAHGTTGTLLTVTDLS